MPEMSTSPTLGAWIRHRRRQLHISQDEARRRADVSLRTWIRWENDSRSPAEKYWAAIEEVLLWAPGSVAAILAGNPPVLVEPAVPSPAIATVTPIRPEVAHDPPDDDAPLDEATLFAEWRDMGMPEAFIEEYRDRQAGLLGEYRDRARRAARG